MEQFFLLLFGSVAGGLLGWAGKCALKWQGERLAGPPLILGDKSIKRQMNLKWSAEVHSTNLFGTVPLNSHLSQGDVPKALV